MNRPENPDAYYDECVAVNAQDLQGEYVRVAADLAYWNERFADVYAYWLERKEVTEQVSSRRFEILKVELEIEKVGGGRVTLAEVESALRVDEDVIQAKSKQHSAEAEKVRLAGRLDAIRTKRDMIVSLGAHIRAELEGDPMLRADARVAREVRGARET